MQGSHGKQHVLALLDGSYIHDVSLWQHIFGVDLLELLFALSGLEFCAAALVYDVYFRRVNATEAHDVSLGTLADGYDAVCLATGLVEFPCVYFGVYPVVVFGMTHEYEVVDGDDGLDAGLPDAERQFASQSMIEVHTVFLQVFHYSLHSPQVSRQLCVAVMRINEFEV